MGSGNQLQVMKKRPNTWDSVCNKTYACMYTSECSSSSYTNPWGMEVLLKIYTYM